MAALRKFLTTACTASRRRRLTPRTGDSITSARCFHTVGTTKYGDGDGDDEAIKSRSDDSESESLYPFQISGPSKYYDLQEIKEGYHLRFDFPGVNKDGLKVWAEDGHFIRIEGREKTDEWASGLEEGRFYRTKTYLNPRGSWNADKMRVEMNNGVLEITVPRYVSFTVNVNWCGKN